MQHLLVILLLMSVMISSSAGRQPCKCSGEDQKKRPSVSAFYDTIYGTYPIITDYGPYSYTNSSAGLVPIGPLTWRRSSLLTWRPRVLLPIISIAFNVSVYRPQSQAEEAATTSQGLAFILLPVKHIYSYLYNNGSAGIPVVHENGSLVLNNPDTKSAAMTNYPIRDTNTSVSIGTVKSVTNYSDSSSASSAMGINITIIPKEASNQQAGMEYAVWIDFDRPVGVQSTRISVFVEGAAMPKPDKPIIASDINISDSEYARLQGCFFSSIGQLSQIHGLTVTSDDLRDQGSSSSRLATILGSVFGSLGGSAVIGAVVAWYLNSSYRRWKKELDQLAKSMQSLPGVPVKISFTDIRTATNNFHDTRKLGRGAFGAVYRCQLQSLKEQPMEVAVKKFTRSDTRCYEDFLAEVSIINRLRHKNIVPLVG